MNRTYTVMEEDNCYLEGSRRETKENKQIKSVGKERGE
jgi:hypothetical protein